MSIYTESGFQFDFDAALHSVIHDKADPHEGNTFWPGIDFRIFEDNRQVWIEVKSWSTKQIHRQGQQRSAHQDFTHKMKADEFREDIFNKFLGTTSYLAWSEIGIPNRVFYIVFLEPPSRGSAPLLNVFQDRLRNEFKNAQAAAWGRKIEYEVVSLARFQALFPNYPVTRI